MKFCDLPMLERWNALDIHLVPMIEAATKAATVSPTEEMAVAEIAERHGLSVLMMVRKLRRHGGLPYRFGTKWFIRARSYALALTAIEIEQNRAE
ncbi:hypothetical protein OKA04_09870 [Luteolibacter flavescens]|uniref:DNA-binding protein n=1 Tax=Luteolibacter flavescens TaxID=1859460 RepID=A0ABT3FNA1_9BACT|nr:hypothetical protein [Luteolibacter flavescens]MCW1885033.1 hypothetical protein [Luteolibacter flavescens]